MNASTRCTSRATSVGQLTLAFAFVFVLLLALVFWPQTRQLIPALADPPTVQSLGSVTGSSFIGGFGTRTQVNTATRTLLLSGAIELDKGTLVERRSTMFTEKLCVIGTDRCHDIASR